MKSQQFLEMMATWADAEQRSTASLIEMLAAAALMKAAPPQGKEVATITLGEADLLAVLTDFHYKVQYVNDEMTVFLTRIE